ncbi:MAG: imidazolonepropionase [Alicyclobacillus sp.]|nr:imidazolonepropionase [Alicyclobacillus sp.]
MPGVHRIIDNIGLLWTMDDSDRTDGPRRGREAMRAVGALRDAAIAVGEDGSIVEVGPRRVVRDLADGGTDIVDAGGGFACPGFVDAHTHLVHGGSREHELPLRIQGASYLDILKAGGGILRTVRDTVNCGEDLLYRQARASALRMLGFGVTTVEAKTGYGLTLDAELKQLRVAKRLEQDGGQSFVHTAMPAHAIPASLPVPRERWIDEIVRMLPHLQAEGAEFADVFVEDGVFTAEEGRHILTEAKRIGMKLKIHADEMAPCGGAELAAELGATSADHLLAATDEGLLRMAEAGVIAVCLPGTSFYLQKPPARARFMIDEAGLAVAVASDYNPGSCPSENFAFMMSLALLALRMTPEEVFMAATRNAAYAVDRGATAGILRPGRPADVVVFHAPNPEYVLTRFAVSHVHMVYAKGQRIA